MDSKIENNNEYHPRRKVIRNFLRTMINIGFSLLCDIDVFNRENIPINGPVILVGNHFSFLDPVAMIKIVPGDIEFIGGTQLVNAPKIVRWIPKIWGYHNVHRGASSRDALVSAQEILKSGGKLGLFPEGTSGAKILRSPRPGAALLAARTEAPLLPIGFDGFENIFPSIRKGKRARVNIRIGEIFGPFSINAKGRADRQELDFIGDTIMKNIAGLIPPEKRGMYSDDPILRSQAKSVEDYHLWTTKPEE